MRHHVPSHFSWTLLIMLDRRTACLTLIEFLSSWRWRQQVFLTHRYLFSRLHAFTSLKTVMLIEWFIYITEQSILIVKLFSSYSATSSSFPQSAQVHMEIRPWNQCDAPTTSFSGQCINSVISRYISYCSCKCFSIPYGVTVAIWCGTLHFVNCTTVLSSGFGRNKLGMFTVSQQK